MPINPNLLIAAPMLQDYLVDKTTGKPLVNGIVTLYKDNARSFYKNWYYQTGSPGAYTYIPLNNPLHLSSVGTIQDPNGNDVIPFYYPYEENNQNIKESYYITVYSSDQNGDPDLLQFTRENFPFLPGGSSGTQVPTFRNYILNNVYWRNIGSQNLTSITDLVVAPSQHDGYTNGDIRFLKDITGATDLLSFNLMTDELVNDITPEYYANVQCTNVQLGETVKCFQYPISLHVDTLSNVTATVVIHAQDISSGSNNFLDIQIYQYLGTGAISQPLPITIERITLTENFEKFTISVILPSSENVSLGSGGDDALFLRVQYPLAATFNINHTKPQIYLSDTVPDNDFDTYDQVETIINSPRTGDVRQSMNSFYPYGWVPSNNGTIGSSSSNATSRSNIDTWPLYNLLWTLSKPYDSGSNFNPICQIVTSGGSDTNYGTSSYSDFTSNKALMLTKTFGQVLIGSVPTSALLSNYMKTITASDDSGNLLITVGSITGFYNYQPIVFTTTGTLPGNIVSNSVYFITGISGNTFHVATSFSNAISGVPVVSWSSAGSNSSVISNVPGINFGENAHTQLETELATHSHPGSTIIGFGDNIAPSPGTAPYLHMQSPSTTPLTIAPDGNSVPFNIIQPSTFFNVFIKL